MDIGSRAPTLNAQVVLYESPLVHVWRLLEGLAASAEQARRHDVISSATLSIADCSSIPVLGERDLADLEQHAKANGLAQLEYQFLQANLGHSGGHNRLARDTDCDILLFLNPDTYPSPNMLVELIPTLTDPAVGLAEARQIPLEHPKEFDPATGDTSWASGCCLVVRKDVFWSVDGFDEKNFPIYCNDVDLSWRLRLAGFRVVLVATAVIFHDKEIAPSGHPVSTPAEPYHSALGRLLLASRYDRPDVLEETIQAIGSTANPDQLAALAEFRRRQEERRVPKPIADANHVAQFVGGEYARHRF